MPMLAFIPWLQLSKEVAAAGVRAVPFGVSEGLPAGVESSVDVKTVRKVLAQYMLAPKRSISNALLLLVDGKSLGADLTEDEVKKLFDFGRNLAVAGLSTRQFVGAYGEYTASGHYQVVVQGFSEPFSGSTVLTHRRKGGSSRVMQGYSDVRFWVPDYLGGQESPDINEDLLLALTTIADGQERWQQEVNAACKQFLLANSDSPEVSIDVLSIATYSALERVAQSSSKLKEAQKKLAELLSVAEHSPWTAQLREQLGPAAIADGRQFQDWVHKLYTLRGSVAHGKPPPALGPWSQHDLLLAGAFVFPLVLKCLLSAKGLYRMTGDDVAHVLGLEGLLGARPFFPSRDKNESELDYRKRCAWLRQMAHIAQAGFDLSLRQTLQKSFEEIEQRLATN